MNKRLTRISVLKAGIVLGVLYALLGCIAVPFFMLVGAMAGAAASHSGAAVVPFGFLFGIGSLFVPVFYGVIGFIGGVIASAVYNLVAKWTGGVEITLVDVV